MRILLLGGAGFIGSSLAVALTAVGHKVTVLDHRPLTADLARRVRYYIGDYSDILLLTELLQQVDVVVHLACSSVPSTANHDPVFDLEANLLPTVKLLELMKASGEPYFVFFSSGGAVYGDALVLPTPEESCFAPKSAYGAMKASCELYIRMLGRLHEYDTLILRPSNPYGPRQAGDGVQGVIGAFVNAAISGNVIRIVGDGHVRRDFIYIDDLVDAVLRAIEARCVGALNVGSGESVSINEVLTCVDNAVGGGVRVERLPSRDFDVRESRLDIRRAQSLLGWSPSTPINEGIERTVSEWKAKVTRDRNA